MSTVAEIWAEARALIASGGGPAYLAATNKKTALSIFDNVPQVTCFTTCPIGAKCYDVHLMKLRPTVMRARAQRHVLMLNEPAAYVRRVIAEIAATNVQMVRIFGGGDFAPRMTPMLTSVMAASPHRTFYMISKTIRSFRSHALTLLDSPNFFLVLSEAQGFTFDEEWAGLKSHSRVNTSYTLMPNESDWGRAMLTDIVFNVSKRRANIDDYLEAGLPLCPCDAKQMPAVGACGACRLCATKGGVAHNERERI